MAKTIEFKLRNRKQSESHLTLSRLSSKGVSGFRFHTDVCGKLPKVCFHGVGYTEDNKMKFAPSLTLHS